MKKFLKAIFEIIALLVGADCDTRRESVAAGICDFSGQGRDQNGK